MHFDYILRGVCKVKTDIETSFRPNHALALTNRHKITTNKQTKQTKTQMHALPITKHMFKILFAKLLKKTFEHIQRLLLYRRKILSSRLFRLEFFKTCFE
jgi:hypothetical protein